VGPFLAQFILQGLLLGGPLAASTGGVVPIGGIPQDAFLLSGIAALAALVMLTLPAISAARRSLAQYKQVISRPPTRPAWARFWLDIILILVGIGFIARLLFFVEGDLGNTLSLLVSDPGALIRLILDSASRTGGLGDPLNLIGPALLLTGVALLWLRLFPLLMRLIGMLIRRSNGLVGPLSIWNVERDPGHYAQLVLLLIGTLALGTAALALGATRDASTWAAAQNTTGGAARIDFNRAVGAVKWTELPGIKGAATLTRYQSEQRAGYTQVFLVGVQPAEMMAVFPQTSGAAQSLVGQKAEKSSGLNRQQRNFSQTTTYPAVISARMARDEGRAFRNDKLPLVVGDTAQIDLQLPGNLTVTLNYRVVGIARNFPSLADDQYFLIMDSQMVAQFVGAVQGLPQAVPNQVWLDMPDRRPAPGLEASIRQNAGVTGITFAWDGYNRLLREPLPAAVAGMLYAGFWVSLVLSLLDFGFYLAVTARRRSLGFAVLQALGWNVNKIWAQLVAEQAVLVAPALLVGIGLGVALAYVILPFLALFGGETLRLPAADLLILLVALLAGFGLLSFGAAWWLRRLNINQVLRLGEE
jgi:putative ABC transport system permease protein